MKKHQSLCREWFASGRVFWWTLPSGVVCGAKGIIMLKWAVIFFIVAIVAAIFGFAGISDAATDIARILFFVFLVLFLISLIRGLLKRG